MGTQTVVLNNQINLTNIKAFFTDARSNQHVAVSITALEPFDKLSLLKLIHAC
jgi:hypothetical protein